VIFPAKGISHARITSAPVIAVGVEATLRLTNTIVLADICPRAWT
jgi:hypothetical protein